MASKTSAQKKRRRRRNRIKAWTARIIFAALLIALIVLAVYAVKKIVNSISESAAKREPVNTTTLTVEKGGGIREVLVEPFDEAVYDRDDLEKTVKDTVSAYGNDMSFEEMTVEDGNVRLSFYFKKPEMLSAFHGIVFNAGTVDTLTSRGVRLPEGAADAGGKNAVVLSDLMDLTEPKLSESFDVVVSKKIRYTSDNVDQDPDNPKKATVHSGAGGTAVIIY